MQVRRELDRGGQSYRFGNQIHEQGLDAPTLMADWQIHEREGHAQHRNALRQRVRVHAGLIPNKRAQGELDLGVQVQDEPES